MTIPHLPDAPLAAIPSLRQVLAGEAKWHVPLPSTLIELPPAVRDLQLGGLSREDVCAALREVRATKNGQEFDVNIVASTSNLVRDGGIIPAEAWRQDLHLYLDNPVVLWQHNPRVGPIGRSVATEIKGRGSNARLLEWWKFNDISEESQIAHALFALGDMKAASVGFYLRAWHRLSEDEKKKLSKKFDHVDEWTWIADRVELIETSAVSVGADPGALDVDRSALEEAYEAMGSRYAYGRTYDTQDAYVIALAGRCAAGDRSACGVLIDGFAGDDVDRVLSDEGGAYVVAPQSDQWDAAAEVAAMDGSRQALRSRHAWATADADPDAAASYLIPHHRAEPNRAVVFRACAAGYARLGALDIDETDKDGIAGHLALHYQDDFDSKPPARTAVELAVCTLAVASGTDAGLDAWTEAHRATVLLLGGGCGTCGGEMIIAESMRRTLEAETIRVDGLKTVDEIQTLIVGRMARVIGTEAREARDRLRQGRTIQ